MKKSGGVLILLAALATGAGAEGVGLAFKADDPEAARAYLRSLLEGPGGAVTVSSQRSARERRAPRGSWRPPRDRRCR